MKKLLLLVVTLLSASFMSAQTMKEIPVQKKFHKISENGKYMITNDQAYVGIYNTETDEFDEYYDGITNYEVGKGNIVTNDGFLVGAVDGMPSILDIENKKWTPLGLKEGDALYSQANAITPSHKYIVGNVGLKGIPYGKLKYKPVLWTLNDDGTYGEYEDLPYPEKDFTGVTPMYILANCISEDGTVIAGQLMRQDNECLPIIYHKSQDGTWTYEVYDEGLCEPGLEFPEFPVEPTAPDLYEFMTEEEIAAYKEDSTAYADSLRQYNNHEIDKKPEYKPEKSYYASDEENNLFKEARDKYLEDMYAFSDQLKVFRTFYYEHVTPNFYAQNSVNLSANGKYYSTTCSKNYKSGDAALFTVDNGFELHDFEDGNWAYTVTNDGDLFVSDKNSPFVYPAGSSECISLADWLKSKGENEAAEWLGTVDTRIAICNSNGRVISGFSGMGGSYRSWIIKLDETPTGITDIEQDGNSHVKAYDLQGRIVAEGEYNEVRNNLKRGIYIINGRKIVVK